jgi:hypothetical protein
MLLPFHAISSASTPLSKRQSSNASGNNSSTIVVVVSLVSSLPKRNKPTHTTADLNCRTRPLVYSCRDLRRLQKLARTEKLTKIYPWRQSSAKVWQMEETRARRVLEPAAAERKCSKSHTCPKGPQSKRQQKCQQKPKQRAQSGSDESAVGRRPGQRSWHFYRQDRQCCGCR